jgi:peptidoglycan/xylan/chitin deacetylase (PgdA/CDA1 family)
VILCYHAVSEQWEHPLAVSPARLEAQLTGLVRRGFAPAGIDDAVGAEARRFHVTFDDAFTSVRLALPILEQVGATATVFVCPAFADGGSVFDVPELAGEARRRPTELRTMAWSELRELRAHGVEIGSHTVTHPHLPSLGDDELALELRRSRERIEQALDAPCRFLAYPYGEHDARVRTAAERAGYEAAFALARTAVRDGGRFALPRVDLYRDDGALRTRLKTSRLYGPLLALRGHARTASRSRRSR